MLTIHLTNLIFHAYHGLYDEEKKIGAKYEVNVSVSHFPKEIPVKHIDETIDYTAIYALVKKRMLQPTPLIETIATTLSQDIFHSFSLAEEVSVFIKKINPPMIGFQGSASVHFSAQRIK